MKLHDPATEHALLQLAVQSRAGRPMEPRDRRRSILSVLGSWFIFAWLLFVGIGWLHGMAGHWQLAVSSVGMMWVALVAAGDLSADPNRQMPALLNLPILGEDILRWQRAKFFPRHAWVVVATSVAVAAGVSPRAEIWLVALLLVGTSYATAVLIWEPLMVRLRIDRIWQIGALAATIGMLVLVFVSLKLFRPGGSPEGLAKAVAAATWIFPHSWCLPGRLEHGGLRLALGWIGWGTARWISWPARVGPFLDLPQDFAEVFGGGTDDEEEEDGDWKIPLPPDAAETENHGNEGGTLPTALELPAGGWVERWVRRVVGPADAVIAGAIVDPQKSWTRQTNQVLVGAPIWLLAVWLFQTFVPTSDFKNTVRLIIWISSLGLLAAALMPLRNGIRRATGSQAIGEQRMLFFCAFPIAARDLLRISTKLTIARGVVLVGIATPVIAAQMWVLETEWSSRVAVGLVPAVAIWWAASRPIFVYCRLQESVHRRRGAGALVAIICEIVTLLVCCVGWLTAGYGGALLIVRVCQAGVLDAASARLAAFAIVALVVSGLFARATFEVFHLRLRRRDCDWLKSP